MTRQQFERFWRLLDLADDYLAGGLRGRHPPPPAGKRPAGLATESDGSAQGSRVVRRGDAGAASTPASAAPGEQSAAAEQQPRRAELAALAGEVTACTLCPLHRERTQAVPGAGMLEPRVLVIGEGPGAEEDRQGLPFVGRAGRYLDDWLAAIDLSRKQNVYITNVVKCRPPGNRDPLPQEWGACNPYLKRQIALLQPAAVLAVGRVATGVLTGSSEGIGKLRGRVHEYEGIPLIATYHPSGVLRNPAWRRPVWEDLKQLRAILSR